MPRNLPKNAGRPDTLFRPDQKHYLCRTFRQAPTCHAILRQGNTENHIPRPAEPADGATHRTDGYGLSGTCRRNRTGRRRAGGHLLPGHFHAGVRLQHRCAGAHGAPQRRKGLPRNRPRIHARHGISAPARRPALHGIEAVGPSCCGCSSNRTKSTPPPSAI